MDEAYSWNDAQGKTVTIFHTTNYDWRIVEGSITGLSGRDIKTTEMKEWRKIEYLNKIENLSRRVTVGNQCELHADESNGFSGYPYNLETEEWACDCVDASEEHATKKYWEQLQLDSHTIVYGRIDCSTHNNDRCVPLYCNPERTHLTCECKIAKFPELPQVPSGYTVVFTDPGEVVLYADNVEQFDDKFGVKETENIAFPALLRDKASGLERIGRVIYKPGQVYHVVNFQFEDGTLLFNLQ